MEAVVTTIKENFVMIVLLVIIALIAAASIVSTIVIASRDGYRRVPATLR